MQQKGTFSANYHTVCTTNRTQNVANQKAAECKKHANEYKNSNFYIPLSENNKNNLLNFV